MSTYLLVDLHNMAHRCLHGTQGTIDIKAGMALHITLNSLRSCWKKFNADHIVFCLEGRSWRKDVYKEYKAQRVVQQATMSKKEKEDVDFFFATFDLFIDFIRDKTNCSVLQCPTAEADDMIARWTQLHPDDKHVIVSTDRDFFQLLSPTVKQYDGMRGWVISPDGYFDEKDLPVVVKKNVNVKDPKSGKMVKKAITESLEKPDPEYALFMKIVRGDPSDNVMSAFPGVREHGSSKKPGIREAFEDRKAKGFNWNNFMLQEWDKLVGADEDGNAITKRVRVIDEYNFNRLLVDLTQQPDEVKFKMDECIAETVSRPLKTMVGIWFLRFTEEMSLFNIGKNPNEYAAMLAAPYAK